MVERAARTRWEIWVVTLAVVVLAAGVPLVNYLRRPSPAPVDSRFEAEPPSAPSADATRGQESAHRGSVDEETRRAIVAALTEAGYTPEATTELLIRRDPEKAGVVTATGNFADPEEPTSSKAGLGVIVLRQDGETWRVVGVRR